MLLGGAEQHWTGSGRLCRQRHAAFGTVAEYDVLYELNPGVSLVACHEHRTSSLYLVMILAVKTQSSSWRSESGLTLGPRHGILSTEQHSETRIPSRRVANVEFDVLEWLYSSSSSANPAPSPRCSLDTSLDSQAQGAV